MKKRIPSYQEFEANFAEIRYTDTFDKQKKLVQYILAGLDSHHEGGLPIDYEQMTIEHIAPQNPDAGPVIAEENVGRLGNLILVGADLNVLLANKPFKKKQEILQGSRVWQDELILKVDAWDDNAILGRTNKLAHLAYQKIWKV